MSDSITSTTSLLRRVDLPAANLPDPAEAVASTAGTTAQARHLLVPISRAEQAVPAASYAKRLMRQGFCVRISLLFVAPESAVMREYDASDSGPAEKFSARNLLARAAGICAIENVETETLVRYGDVVFTVLDIAEQLNCHEIVVAARRLSFIPAFISNSITGRLVKRQRAIPVMTLNPKGVARKTHTHIPTMDDAGHAGPRDTSEDDVPSLVPDQSSHRTSHPLTAMSVWKYYADSIGVVWRMRGDKRLPRVLRYLARSLRHPVASAQWAAMALTVPDMHAWSACTPRLLLRPHRPYISRHYDFAARRKSVLNHYALANRILQADAAELLARGKCLVLASLAGKGEQAYCVTLRKTDKFDREGELVLSLMDAGNDRGIYSLVLTLGMSRARLFHPEICMRIGCMQGPCGDDARELIRHTTKGLHGIRPKDFLTDALYALASAWNIGALYGIGNSIRIFSGARTHADYDSFWRSMGALPSHDGFFELPLMLSHHQLSEVPSRRRSEYRRRMALRSHARERIVTVAQSVARQMWQQRWQQGSMRAAPAVSFLLVPVKARPHVNVTDGEPEFSFLRPERTRHGEI
jgi:uncharacterized protein VirK/YbjX/nucleotide-binding universal stress UspA family protein